MADHKSLGHARRTKSLGQCRSNTLRRHRTSLDNEKVRGWIRDRNPDASQGGNQERSDKEYNKLSERGQLRSRPNTDGFDAFFDRLEDMNPGVFDELLEQLTKWGMRRVVESLKKDVAAFDKEELEEKQKLGMDKKETDQKGRSLSIGGAGDDSLVVSIQGTGNTVNVYESSKDNNVKTPSMPCRAEADGIRERNTPSDVERTFEELEDDPSIDKRMKKAAEKKLKNEKRGTHVIERMQNDGACADGFSENLLSMKGNKNHILHRRVFLNHDGYSISKGGQSFLCIAGLVKSICKVPVQVEEVIEKGEVESLEKIPKQVSEVSVHERSKSLSRDKFPKQVSEPERSMMSRDTKQSVPERSKSMMSRDPKHVSVPERSKSMMSRDPKHVSVPERSMMSRDTKQVSVPERSKSMMSRDTKQVSVPERSKTMTSRGRLSKVSDDHSY